MLRLVVVLGLVAAAVATPPLAKTREEIQEFRSFLESTQADDGTRILPRGPASELANAEENSGRFQGDIVLDDWAIQGMVQAFAEGRNAYVWPSTKWPDDVVVWEIAEGEFGPLQTAAIWDGVRDIENHTCVKFRYREPHDTVYVSVTGEPSGCYAHVGYWETRGVHTLNLARNTPGVGCFRHGTIVHEWMHILGFLHMHSTWDRDRYVRIEEQNVIPTSMHNFDIYAYELVSNLDITYDFVSCLQYSRYAFTINGEPTIVALQEHEGDMGQRLYITDKDWLRINRHYYCPRAWNMERH